MSSRKNKRVAAKHVRRRRVEKIVKSAKPTPAALQPTDGMTDTLALGKACWDQGRRDEAIELYERAVKETPSNVRALVLTADAYAWHYRLPEMEDLLERLGRLGREQPGITHLVAEVYAKAGLPGRSLAWYERAASMPGSHAETFTELAALYERSHRFDEAHAALDRAGGEPSRSPLACLTRARLRSREKQPEQAEQTLVALAQAQPEDSEWVPMAWAEVAQIRDRQGDYAGAVEAIDLCKQRHRAKANREIAAANSMLHRFGETIDALTPDHLQRWQDQTASLPDTRTAVLTGFPRSGTTLLEQVLDAHPDVVSSEERDFFSRVQYEGLTNGQPGDLPFLDTLDALTTGRIRAEQRRYLGTMEQLRGEPIGGRVHLDKNPAYNPLLPAFMRLFPQTRTVVALRDPRDVVLSCYLRYLPLNPVSASFLSFEGTARRYAQSMDTWLKLREMLTTPWCEVRYEDSVADLEGQARRALDTLGLAWDPAVMSYRDRLGAERHVSSPTYAAVKQPVYTHAVGRWKHYEAQLAPVMEALTPYVEAFGYDA